MGNAATVIEEHRNFLISCNVPQDVIERINYEMLYHENKNRIREEVLAPLKRRMRVLEGEHTIIVMDFYWLDRRANEYISSFNNIMLRMGFRAYENTTLRARYHMEYLKKNNYNFDEFIWRYICPRPKNSIVQPEPSDVVLITHPNRDDSWEVDNEIDYYMPQSSVNQQFGNPMEVNKPPFFHTMESMSQQQFPDYNERDFHIEFPSTCITSIWDDDVFALRTIDIPDQKL